MKRIDLCYGTFFTVLSEFKTDTVNRWQLHNRFMNIEYIPFGDVQNALPLTIKNFNERYTSKDSCDTNPYERIDDYAHCRKTKTLPIQGSRSRTDMSQRTSSAM